MSLIASLLIFLVAGLAGGLLLGLMGVGMALIAVPLLTLFLPQFGVSHEAAPLVAIATSMAIVSVGAISSSWSHHRMGNVLWKLIRQMLPFSLMGVATGSLLAPHLPGWLLKSVFVVFLLFMAAHMLLSKDAQASSHSHVGSSAAVNRTVGALIGLAGSLIGAGGGIFMVPFLNHRGHAMAKAVATSTVIGLPVSVLGALIHAVQPSPVAVPGMLGHIYLPAFIGVGFGSLLSAPLGARLASRVPAKAMKRGFAVLLLVIAVRLLMEQSS